MASLGGVVAERCRATTAREFRIGLGFTAAEARAWVHRWRRWGVAPVQSIPKRPREIIVASQESQTSSSRPVPIIEYSSAGGLERRSKEHSSYGSYE
ncbi:hypothetical protein M0R45_009299 [Rubus argutus]|uniref:Uncharacterized protein n=1 Tax=Rubus argutus TaxID=59490 RepID=A0AAW1Y4I6_RUBAR